MLKIPIRKLITNVISKSLISFLFNLDTPHLKGLDKLIEDFLIINKLRKANNFSQYDKNKSINNSINLSRMNMNTHSTIVIKFFINYNLSILLNYFEFLSPKKQIIISFLILQILIWQQRKIKLMQLFRKK